MNLKSGLAKVWARWEEKRINKWTKKGVEIQKKTLKKLLKEARHTEFGRDHNFEEIIDYESYKKAVPIRDYEGLKNYFDQIKNGKENVLWPGKPIYLCKTSGTTSGTKYIPLTKASFPNHTRSARNALLAYIRHSGSANFLNGKYMFIQGSPVLDKKGGILTGRLSGIVAHHIPNYLLRNRLPGMETNSIEDWETKIDTIVRETQHENMTVLAGIPPWVQMYFEKMLDKTGKNTMLEVFPNLELMVTGGVNFEPYSSTLDKLIGRKIHYLETYPASEGFFAYQDTLVNQGLLLLLNEGIFYEFVKADEIFDETPTRITIEEVEPGVNYALIINSNAGLWAYLIGDTVKFVSLDPYRLVVTGRTKHFTSAFGEHVIAEEVEKALEETVKELACQIREFSVAPQVLPPDAKLPYHEWFIEFEKVPKNMEEFRKVLDQKLCQKNSYYSDLIEGKVLQPLKVSMVKKNGFNEYMKEKGKLGGQNKVARLSNDRKMADALLSKLESG